MARIFLVLAGVAGFSAVGLGAFGAHALRDRLAALTDGAQRLEWWHTAANYHLAHALALGLVGLLARAAPSTPLSVAGWAFAAGIVVFAGSLYAMTLTGVRVLGAITPIGGLCFLVGWAALALSAWQRAE